MRNSVRENNHSLDVWLRQTAPRRNGNLPQAPNGRQVIALLLTILLVVSSLLVRVEAADGDLDPTFGAGGKLTTDFIGPDFGSSIAIQSDGKIVVAGYVADHNFDQVLGLARYEADGNLDTTFGVGGIVKTNLLLGSLRVDVAIQDDGKIVVAGTVGLFGMVGFSSDFVLARFDTDGNLDPLFGTGGVVITDFFGDDEEAGGVTIQSDGKIIIAGRCSGIVSGFALARYDTDGNLDGTFGIGGKVANPGGFARDVAVQSDGKIIAVGGGGDFALARYDADGNLDASFGTGGITTTDFSGRYDEGRSVALQNDGKIVVAGSAGNVTPDTSYDGDFGIARYDTNGNLDASFGMGGKVITDFFGGVDIVNDIAIQSDGKIVVAGSINPDTIDVELRWDFGLARYDTTGNLDPTFGASGKITTDFQFHDEAGGVALQQGCKIVVAGFSWSHETGTVDFALTRYDSGGCVVAYSCPLSQGHWKNNPSTWPVDSLTLGSQTYTKAELLELLNAPSQTDASLILARQLIAAKLNIANGSDPAPVSSIITHADSLLIGFAGKLPYDVKSSSANGQAMVTDGAILNSYNNGFLTSGCAP